MIVSNKFIRAKYGEPLREHLASAGDRSKGCVDLAGLPVFRGATVRTIVMLTRKGARTGRSGDTQSPISPPPSKGELLPVVAGHRPLGRDRRPARLPGSRRASSAPPDGG